MRTLSLILGMMAVSNAHAQPLEPSPGNRLAYLNELDPCYSHARFPKLITPQWIGDPDIEAVVILSMNDVRDLKKTDAYLRPVLERLKKIDGRAPVSLMMCSPDAKESQLQSWLKEGLSLEVYSDSPSSPPFKLGLEKAKAAYDECVNRLHAIPLNLPVCCRLAECDSLNTPGPRFWAEIFGKTTDGHHARSALGFSSLPFGAAVEVEAIFEIKE